MGLDRCSTWLALPLAALAWAAPAAQALEEGEQRERIAHEAGMHEARMRNGAHLFDDPQLDAYLDEVTRRLFPEQAGRLRVHAVRNPEFNAYALASGAIYFNTGTLLRLQDEAQLASVLGHEGMHVLADHIYRGTTAAKQSSAVIVLGEAAAAAFGVPVGFGYLAGISTVAGFTRDHEREADVGGFERMVRAGYDPRSGAETFGRLDRELDTRRITPGPYFFASHPRVRERVATQQELAARQTGSGERNAERYRAVTLRARMHALEQIHRLGDGVTLVFLLEDEKLLDTLPVDARYYLAEGFRLRAQAPRKPPKDALREAQAKAARDRDLERAQAEYLRTTVESPLFAPPWQALGNHHLRLGDKREALRHFERYLELEPDPARSGYARQSLESLRSQLGKEAP